MGKKDDERRAEQRDYEVKRALAVLKKHSVAAPDDDVETLRREHEEYRQAVMSLEERRLELEERLSGDALHHENETLRQQGRQRDWRDAWRSVATEAGMIPKAIDAAWRNHGPKAESDQPDRKALESLCLRLRTEHDYFWPQAPTPAPVGQPEARESTPAIPATPANGTGPRFTFANGKWSNGSN